MDRLARGTRPALASGDNEGMSLAADWRAGWAGRAERVAAARYGPAAVTGLLGLAAVIEAVARAAVSTYGTPDTVAAGRGAQFLALGLLYSVLGLATTLPLAFPRPAPAAAVLSAASLLSLGVFHFLTLAGAAAELAAAYRSGRGGPGPGAGAAPGLRGDGADYAALRPDRAVPGAGARHRRGGGHGGVAAHGGAGGAGPGGGLGRGRPALARARPGCTPPRRRPSRARWWSTRPAASGRASPVSCTTWSRTTSR